MEVEIRRNPERVEPVLILEVSEITAETEALAERLRAMDSGILMGWRDGKAYRLEPGALVRFFAQDKEVYAEDAGQAQYLVRKRLYELEDALDKGSFVRISHSEIVNLRRVKALNLCCFSAFGDGILVLSFVFASSGTVGRPGWKLNPQSAEMVEGGGAGGMKAKRIMRIIALLMLLIAVVYVYIVASVPTLGHVFYIGSFRVDAYVMWQFYKGYLVVIMLLLALSFINWKHK